MTSSEQHEQETKAHVEPPGDVPTPDGTQPSGRLVELLAIFRLRRRGMIATAAGVSLLGLVLAIVAPGLVPPTPLVGAVVGVVAVALAVVVAIGLDMADLTVRGDRHIRAAGAHLLATVTGPPAADTLGGLVDELDDQLPREGTVWVGLAPAASNVRNVPAWTGTIGAALAGRDRRLLVIDLAAEASPEGQPGVAEIVRDGLRLSQSVAFDPVLSLARVGPGPSQEEGLTALPALHDRVPPDVDIVLVTLPPVSRRGALTACTALDHVIVLAEQDRTPRVSLIATLDAVETSASSVAVVLVDADRPRPTPDTDVDTEEMAESGKPAPAAAEPAPPVTEPPRR